MLRKLVILPLLVVLGLVGPGASFAASPSNLGSVKMKTDVTFFVTGTNPLSDTVVEYTGQWAGTVSGDVNGQIAGTQTGTIYFDRDLIVFSDNWTIAAPDGSVAVGTDQGRSKLMPKLVGPQRTQPATGQREPSRAANYQAEMQIGSATGSLSHLAGRTGFENGKYFVIYNLEYPGPALFFGQMEGNLMFRPAKSGN